MRALFAVAFLLLPTLAFADVVGEPPETCPEGSTPETCHGGPYCAPVRCTDDTDCDDGRVCETRSYCTGVVNCAGLIGPGEDPRDFERDTIEGSCDECSTGACNEIRLCVLPLPAGEGGGGCSAAKAPAGAFVFAGFLVAVLVTRRRRQRIRG